MSGNGPYHQKRNLELDEENEHFKDLMIRELRKDNRDLGNQVADLKRRVRQLERLIPRKRLEDEGILLPRGHLNQFHGGG